MLIAWHYLIRNFKLIGAGLLLVLVLIVVQVKFHLFYKPNTLRIGLIGTYQQHDLPYELTSLFSSGLTRADKDGRIKPDLVSGWEVNNDATQFKFKLKKNLQWVDGTTVKSQDLEFGIPDVSVSYPDDLTIQFNLKEPYAPFPSLLTKPVYKRGTILGTGPYAITKLEKSLIFITKITLEPRGANNAQLPTLYVRFYPSEKIALTGFNLGEVELVEGVTSLKMLPQNPQVALKQRVDYSKIVTILYSMNDAFLGGKNRSLRQALSYIIPPIKNSEVADNPYPKTSWAYDREAKKYLGNPDEAKSAMERAKPQIGDDKLHAEIILTAIPNLEETGKEVVAAWRSLGFDAKLRLESGIPQNFQALLITQSIPEDPDQYFLWHASQIKTNLSKFDSKRVDKDLEDGRKDLNEEERKAKYFDFQKALLEEAPATFLYFPNYNILYYKKSGKRLEQILNVPHS